VLPEVVTVDEDGYLAVAYAEIVPVLISAFNEHMAKYNEEQFLLKRRFDAFEVQLATLTEGIYNSLSLLFNQFSNLKKKNT